MRFDRPILKTFIQPFKPDTIRTILKKNHLKYQLQTQHSFAKSENEVSHKNYFNINKIFTSFRFPEERTQKLHQNINKYWRASLTVWHLNRSCSILNTNARRFHVVSMYARVFSVLLVMTHFKFKEIRIRRTREFKFLPDMIANELQQLVALF